MNIQKEVEEKINLNYYPKEQRTFDLCYKAVKINKMQLKYIPDDYLEIECIEEES